MTETKQNKQKDEAKALHVAMGNIEDALQVHIEEIPRIEMTEGTDLNHSSRWKAMGEEGEELIEEEGWDFVAEEGEEVSEEVEEEAEVGPKQFSLSFSLFHAFLGGF